jgi:hypothetical protein
MLPWWWWSLGRGGVTGGRGGSGDECSTEHSRCARWRKRKGCDRGEGAGMTRWAAQPGGGDRLEVGDDPDGRAPPASGQEREGKLCQWEEVWVQHRSWAGGLLRLRAGARKRLRGFFKKIKRLVGLD